MKQVTLLILTLVLFTNIPVFAAFPIRSTETVSQPYNIQNNTQRVINHAPKKGKASTAQILGILSLVTVFWGGGIFLGIPAIIIGAHDLKEDEGARTGMICGIVSVGITLLIFAFFIFLITRTHGPY